MKKTIGNFTQTYQGTPSWSPGSDFKSRDFLIETFCKDINKINCYNLLDLRTFSFHNIDLERAKQLGQKLKGVIPDIYCTCYNNITLAECIYKQLLFLKEKGMTDFLWVQDDEFFTSNNFSDYVKFFNYYKQAPHITNVCLCMPVTDTAFKDTPPEKVIKISDTNLNLYKFKAKKLHQNTKYPMNFTAFICNIDYFLQNMFDISFLTIVDAYQLEYNIALKAGFTDVDRYCFNESFFESFNIVGMLGSLGDSELKRKKLKELFDI